MNSLLKNIFAFLTLISSALLFADKNVIGKVEHPYVQSQEKELSILSLYQKDTNKNHVLKQKFSVGRAFSDSWFGEISLSGEEITSESFDLSSYEIEAKWQITEQGEYSTDYGLLFEYENEYDSKIEESSVTFLAEKQWGKWVGTVNVAGIYEWGDNIENEFESSVALQARYRYKPTLEPAIELYSGEKNKGVGPVLTGVKRLAPGKKLNWEMGVIFGLDTENPDQTYRALLEYEF